VKHQIRRGWKDKLIAIVPFGLGSTKPQQFAEGNVLMARDRCDAAGGVPDYNAVVRVESV